jgi:ABC-type dipeptide/oligopeptide/nickel transport system permease component
MYRYVTKRFLGLVPTIIGLTLIAFLLLRLIPGDPVVIMLGENASPDEIAKLREKLRLDDPLHVQYFAYLSNLMMGDWGTSIFIHQPVFPLILQKFQATIILVALSMALAITVGITLGILGFLYRGRWIYRIINVISIMGFSIPVFWMGLTLIFIFSITLGVLPSLGKGGPEHLVMPVLTLTFALFGVISRTTIGSMIDESHETYLAVARAKGLSKFSVISKHLLRNAIIPVITIAGLQLAALFGGAIITEYTFNYSGIGLLLVENIFRRDYPVIQGCIFFIGVLVAVLNVLIDIIYGYVDPRVRYERSVT